VREVWERNLGVSPIGPDDDFFDLGGSSLMAVQVIQEISYRLDLDLPMSALFQAPTVAGLAATIRESAGGFGSTVRPNRPPKVRTRWKRRMIDLTGRLLAAPIVALHRVRLLSFETGGQLLSLVPGRPGLVVRRGWYRMTLEGCGEVSVGFGSMITDYRSRLGDRCSVGPLCNIGWVDIGDDVLIASHVVVLGGGRQHGITDLERPMRSQPGVTERVTIGSDVWLGTGATVMADVAPHTIVTAGATVTRSFAPYAVLGGVPAQATGSRLPPP
jgi:virginiamycin A acetyltransferase